MKEQSTDFLLNELSNITNPTDIANYIKKIESLPNKSFSDFFLEYESSHPELTRAKIIENSGLARNYAYEVLNGKKNASRDRAIALCFSAGMNIKETNHALKYSGNNELDIKNSRDAVIFAAINLKQTNAKAFLTVIDLNLFLERNHQEPLKLSRDIK